MLPLLDRALELAQERLQAGLPERERAAVGVKRATVHTRLTGLALHHDPLAREVRCAAADESMCGRRCAACSWVRPQPPPN